MMLEKEWVFLDENIDDAQADAYAKIFDIPKIVAKVLLNRGLTDAADAKKSVSMMQILVQFM